jgi:carbon-monoxide dehydrogenase small subunit
MTALRVNGTHHALEVPVYETLAETLRERLKLNGTKIGCDDGSCGTCTVVIDARPVYACMVLTLDCANKDMQTIEGLGTESEPHALQVTFADGYAAQCGFCTPGMIMAAAALLDRNRHPSEADVRLGLSGVLCRCGYRKIIEATLEAARRRSGPA